MGEVETRWCRKDGSRVDILLRSAAFDPNDLSRGMIFTALDIGRRKEAARMLEEKERYYRSLINSLQEDIVVIDRDLRITDLNNGSLKTSGHRRAEIIGKHCYSVLHGADGPCRDPGGPCGHETVLKTGQVVRQQHRHQRRDGSVLWADVLYSPISDAKGRITHVVESVRNVTPFVEQQAQLKRQNTQLEALFETVLGITKHRRLSSLLEAIVEQAASLAGVPNAFLHIYDPHRKILETRAACGAYHDLVGYDIKPGEGLSGTVFEKGASMYVQDYQSWLRRLPDDRFATISAIAAVPLKQGNEVVGVLGLSHNEPGRTISETAVLPVLERFATLAMVAISNARLTRRLQNELRP
ncbi:MAG TPA: PAS domain S-box protein, partial [Chromatiaceae bacterium]|nr:PAS domain S-box protein [Chromatiaceae bacterium]